MAGAVPMLRWEPGCMYERRASQQRAGGRVGRATLCPSVCSQEAVLWDGTGKPEFQVLLRISLFDLLRSGKEDLEWDFPAVGILP